ncbi:hypothetical protein [Pyrodictium abyssi]|uniref:HEPN domain-containing protein n=1 Tax=Pyrodictium abyssi TaxID=54256 RepID=A0ABM8J0E3_9CREN|nr:hypothetical protein PABY_17710 [Pyrodictium abyssi]
MCKEIDSIVKAVYGSKACLSLGIQAVYAVNILVKDLILDGKRPSKAHVEALVGTIMAWGRLPPFKLAEIDRRDAALAIMHLLNSSVGAAGYGTLRDYASWQTIVDAASLGVDALSSMVERAIKALRAP